MFLDFVKGARSFTTQGKGFTGIKNDVTGTDFIWATQSVTTSALALGDGAITTPGYVCIKNIEAAGGSNYIEVRDGSGGADVVKVRPQGLALFELATSTPFVIANGSAAEIIYAIVET